MDEFKVKLAPNVGNKKYTVFKLHKDDNVSWQEAKMRRENESQPWQIKIGSGRTGRRFKAIKEGGVADNASYFVFYKPNDKSDTYEVCPIEEWYNVSATQRYKTLTAEEAELKFEQRHKMFNLFSVMHLKKNGENGEEGGGVGGSEFDGNGFKVSELDDWDQSGDDEASDDENGMGGNKKKNQRKKSGKKDKDDPEDAPDEAKEDSDEGDFEQREVDYMSDSSSESDSSQEDAKDETDVKGIAEEEALRDLLSTDDEEDGENPQQKGSKSNENKIAISSGLDNKQEGDGSEDSSDSDDYDVDEDKMDSMFMKKSLPAHLSMVRQETKPNLEQPAAGGSGSGAGGGSTSGASNGGKQVAGSNKRKAPESPSTQQPAPPQPMPSSRQPEISSPPLNAQEKIVEDLIRKYLTRKPMTLKDLLKGIKSKLRRMDGIPEDFNEHLVVCIAEIIKRIKPDKQTINNVVYLSLKS